jgi:beta-alanine degradation protein BauB
MVLGLALSVISTGAFAAEYPGPHEAGPNIYRLISENDEVRVSEIKFGPGETIPMHHHSYGHSLYVVEGGQLTITKPDGTSAVVDAKAGDVMWMGVEDHSAVNTGTSTVRIIITEVKSSK